MEELKVLDILCDCRGPKDPYPHYPEEHAFDQEDEGVEDVEADE